MHEKRVDYYSSVNGNQIGLKNLNRLKILKIRIDFNKMKSILIF